MISSGHLSWLAQNLGIWFRNRGCRLPQFELASAECSILCLLLNMCSKRSAARCQTELLAVAWTGSPTASPKSLAKLASSRHSEHGQRLTGYVDNSELIAKVRYRTNVFGRDSPVSVNQTSCGLFPIAPLPKHNRQGLRKSSIPDVSGVQINPNREQLSTEEADCGGIAGAARQLIREPPLAFAWIIIGKQVGCAAVPTSPQPIAQFQAHVRITHNIANVPSFLAVLCHDPKLPAHEPVAHGRTARLSGLAAGRFQEPISCWD